MTQSIEQQPLRLIARNLVIVMVRIEALVPDPKNARQHSKKQIRGMAASMREFGFINPVLIDEWNGVIAGHGRLEAAPTAGMTEVPCIRLVGLSAHQRKALALADNKLHDMSSFDPDQLLATLTELESVEYNIELTGFDTAEFDVLQEAATAFATAADAADLMPPPDLPAVSRNGDLWQLGGHRLLCGNSLEEASFERLLGADRADLVIVT